MQFSKNWMANQGWFELFPEAALLNLPIHRSDCNPLVLDTCWAMKRQRRPKRLEEVWLKCEEVSQISRRVWEMRVLGSIAFKVLQKQKILLRHLVNWSNLSLKFLDQPIGNVKKELDQV